MALFARIVHACLRVAIHARGLARQRRERHIFLVRDIPVACDAIELSTCDMLPVGEGHVRRQARHRYCAIATLLVEERADATLTGFVTIKLVVAWSAQFGWWHARLLAAQCRSVAEGACQLVVDHMHTVWKRRFRAPRRR